LRRATVSARTALEDAIAAAAEATQRAMLMAEILDEALAALEAADGVADTSSAQPATRLSPREREVLALVAEGRTNKAIAEALYVSPNTVKTHVASLLNKLQAGSRTQLAAIAARQLGPRPRYAAEQC
jgi:DNA-binding NarL/FixJ family response regulator